MTTQIENYGYILIDTDAKRKRFAPKLATDEFFEEGEWVGVYNDSWFATQSIYRRKIDPGEGFELVGLDEVVDGECEWTHDGMFWGKCGWLELGGIKELASELVTNPKYMSTSVLAFRRRKSAPVKSEKFWCLMKRGGEGVLKPTEFQTYDSAAKVADEKSILLGIPIYIVESVARVQSVPASVTVVKL